MDDDLQTRLDQLDKRIAAVDKRIDDLKWGAGLVIGLVAGLVALAATLGTLNFNAEKAAVREFQTAEKAAMREFQKELKASLGQPEPPVIELLGLNGNALAGQTISGKLEVAPGVGPSLLLLYIMRNSGDGPTGQVYTKVYTVDGINLGALSADEPKYKYESALNPKLVDVSEFPGRYSAQMYLRLRVYDPLPKKGDYAALLKLYYGKGKVASAPITIRIEQTSITPGP